MANIGPDRAQIRILTTKEGILSTVAHDLQLRATRFEIRVEGDGVVAEIDPASLEVMVAMKDGKADISALSPANKLEIAKNMREDVLHTSQYPSVRFEGKRQGETSLKGKLTLHGTTRDITLALRHGLGRATAEISLDQRDFGIKPYRALLGALRVAAVLRIEIESPWPLA